MIRRVGSLMVLAAVLAFARTGVGASQLGEPAETDTITGAAGVRGRVVAADDGKPVRRAQVRVFGLPTSRPATFTGQIVKTTETNDNGFFEVGGLPAGVYNVDVEPVVGFIGTLLLPDTMLTDGQTRQMTIRVQRTGAIEGRVYDDRGEPVVGVRVEAIRRRELGGEVLLSAGRTATTDDRGAYRLFDLRPGEYYVLASIPHRPRVNDGPPPNAASERWGYRPTFHPASASRGRARAVPVRAGRDSSRVDVSLARTRLSRVAVQVVDSKGEPLGSHAPMLIRRDDVHLESSTYYGRRQPDGTYVFAGVVPDDYDLLATDPQRRTEVAYVKVAVGETDLSLQVRTNAGARVTGRVLVDGQPVNAAMTRSLNVGVSAFPPYGKYGFSYAESRVLNLTDSDRFVLTGLRGPMVLSGDVSSGALVSVRRAGEQIAGKTLDFDGTETIDDVVIEVTTKVAELDVAVTGTRAADDPESVTVLLFPEDASRWHPGFIRYSGTAVSREPPVWPDTGIVGWPGRQTARFIRMPAGRYFAVAISDAEFVRPLAPALFERLRPVATPVTLGEGEKARLSLRVARLPR